jgi:hypothetical protein
VVVQVEKKFLVLEHFSTPGCVFSTHFSKCLFLVSGRECARPAGERFPGELTGFAFLISGDGSSEATHVVSAFIVDKVSFTMRFLKETARCQDQSTRALSFPRAPGL